MRAAVYYGPSDVRIESVPDPGPPGPGELLLRVTRAGICGTDAAEYTTGPHFIPLRTPHPANGHVGPLILGHEFTGEVVAVGSEVEAFRVGDRVVPGAGIWCERCEWCLAGRTNLCARYYTLGLHADGGLAELALAPARICRAVPDGCSDDDAAMAQPFAVALHALRRGGAAPGEAIVFVGAGAIGALMLAGAAAQGIEPIISVDVDPERLESARQLGATHVVDARAVDPVEAIRELTGGNGAPLTIEASGTSRGLETVLAAARRGGRVLLVGMQDQPRAIDLFKLAVREVDVFTTLAHVCDVNLPQALEILARTGLAAHVLDHVIGLDSLVSDGLLAIAERRAKGKILIDPAA